MFIKARRKQIFNGVYLFEFESAQEMGKTFVRFQGHYESPLFRGKIFTRKEYIEKYKKKAPDSIFLRYLIGWGGTNFPSSTLKPFYDGRFKHQTKREKEFLKIFAKTQEPFYVIGAVSGGNVLSLNHEIVHALFYLDEEYRDKVLKVLSKHDCDGIRKHLKNTGYCNAVMKDEINAYLTTSIHYARVFNLMPLRKKLKRLFNRYVGKRG